MENTSKYLNVLGLLCVLTAIIVTNPLGDYLPILVFPARFTHDTLHEWTRDPYPRELLPPEYAEGCPVHPLKGVRVLSRNPDMLYIEGFLSEFETEYLLNAA